MVIDTASVKVFPAFILVVLFFFISAMIFIYFLLMLYPCMNLNTSSKHLSKACLRSTKHRNNSLLNSIAFLISCFKIYMVSLVDRLCRKSCCSSCTLNLFVLFQLGNRFVRFINIFKMELSRVISLYLLKSFFCLFLDINIVIYVLRYYSYVYNFPKSCDLSLYIWSFAF